MRTDYLKDTENKVRAYNTSVNEQIVLTQNMIKDLTHTREQIDREMARLEKTIQLLSQVGSEGLEVASVSGNGGAGGAGSLRTALAAVDKADDDGRVLKTGS